MIEFLLGIVFAVVIMFGLAVKAMIDEQDRERKKYGKRL